MKQLSIDQLKERIRLFVGLTVASVMLITAHGVVTERRDVLNSARRLSAGYVHALAEHSESALSEGDGILRELLGDLRREGGLDRVDAASFHEKMRLAMRDSPQVGTLFIADRQGAMRINSDTYPAKPVQVGDRPYFRRYVEEPGLGLSVGEPITSRLVHRRRFNLMRPLNAPGDPFTGLLALGFETTYFSTHFDPSKLGFRGEVLLVRDDGTPLVWDPHPAAEQEPKLGASPLFRRELPRAKSGVFREQMSFLDGFPAIIAYQHLSRFPVVAVVSLNEDEVLGPWYGRTLRQSALAVGLSLVLIALTRILFSHLDRLKVADQLVGGQRSQLAIKAAQLDWVLDVILQVDREGRILHFNQALCRLTGFSQHELSGARLQDIEPPEFAERVAPNIDRLMQGTQEETFESAFLSRSGALIPVEVHSRMIESEGQPLLLSVVRDITHRKRGEERERNRLRVLERIAGDAPLEELLTAIATFVEEESPGALCSLLLADPTGTTLRHGAAPTLPDYYNRAVDGLRIGSGKGSCGSAAFLRQRVVVEDIEPHPWWQGFEPARTAGLRACWSEPILSPQRELLGTIAIYHRTPAAPGQEDLLLLESAAHLAGIAISRVRSEESRRSLEEQLRHSQKIEALGRLAAEVAHDFNNLLTPIMVYADLLRRGLSPEAPQMKMVEAMGETAQKASELTQKLLSFGRKQLPDMSPVDLNEVVRAFGGIMRTTVRASIGVEYNLSPTATGVLADRGQLEQALLNLVVNAQDAIAERGTISVETGHLVLDDEFLGRHPGLDPGAYVLLAVTDDGCGMDEGTLHHVFEPFFTTKEAGRGTGLGLPTVYAIVKHHGGCLEIKTRPGEGTRVEIYLPSRSGLLSAALQSAAPAEVPVQVEEGGTVLLVEDNAAIRETVTELLHSFGYQVLSAALPAEALEMAAGVKVDLLATDVVMPQLSGPELYERLLEGHPSLPVLYISGYSINPLPGDAPAGGGFLAKPFTVEQFLDRVRRMMAGTRGKHGAESGEQS
ncbi:hypothetical protein GMSM_23260 [Geomonas sp. Red276]